MFLRAWDTIRGLLLGEKVEMAVFGIPGSPHGRWFGFHGEIFCLSCCLGWMFLSLLGGQVICNLSFCRAKL